VSVLLGLVVAISGLHGIVMRGPTTPVCEVGKPCSEPAVGTVLVFSRSGRSSVRVRAGAGGRYTVRLDPGFYAVTVAPAPRIGTGLRPRQVRVRAAIFGRLDFEIDTGIR